MSLGCSCGVTRVLVWVTRVLVWVTRVLVWVTRVLMDVTRVLWVSLGRSCVTRMLVCH